METLIIHPEDKSTDFLCPIYEGIKGKSVIRGGISKKELLKAVKLHQRIIRLGHGSPNGLFAVGQFEGESHMSYIIDDSFVSSFRDKDNVFIWCHANQFVEQHQLTGFYTGMFISEIPEAFIYDFDVSEEIIDQSNYSFSSIVSNYINEPCSIIHQNVSNKYGELAYNNPIVKYNHERLNYKPLNF